MCYSRDLPQGGVEIPLQFVRGEKEAKKAEKLVRLALDLPNVEFGNEYQANRRKESPTSKRQRSKMNYYGKKTDG